MRLKRNENEITKVAHIAHRSLVIWRANGPVGEVLHLLGET